MDRGQYSAGVSRTSLLLPALILIIVVYLLTNFFLGAYSLSQVRLSEISDGASFYVHSPAAEASLKTLTGVAPALRFFSTRRC